MEVQRRPGVSPFSPARLAGLFRARLEWGDEKRRFPCVPLFSSWAGFRSYDPLVIAAQRALP